MNIQYSYHEHKDGNGNVIVDEEYLSTQGGCFTNYNNVNETIKVKCTESNYESGERVWNSWGNCPKCGKVYLSAAASSVVGREFNHTHSLGKYYLRNCGKTTDTIESATIIY